MELATAKTALNQAAELHDEQITVAFHGGEPLLHFGLIQATTEHGKRFRRQDGSPKFNFFIQTNLSLLNDAILKWAAAEEIQFGFSIDGPPEFNDRFRIYGDGRGTYHDVVDAFGRLRSRGLCGSAIVVVSDIDVVDHLFDFMLLTGIHSLQLNPHFVQGRAEKQMLVPGLQKEYARKVLKLIDQLIEHNLGGQDRLRISNISLLLHSLLSTDRPNMCMRCPCGAALSVIALDVKGSVYPCGEMVGKEELVIGNIRQRPLGQILGLSLVESLKRRRPDLIKDCGTCPIRQVCVAACPNRSYNQTGHFQNRSEMCEFYRTLVPELMWRIYQEPDQVSAVM